MKRQAYLLVDSLAEPGRWRRSEGAGSVQATAGAGAGGSAGGGGVYLQQRSALIQEHSKEKDGAVTIEPSTPEMAAFNAEEERLLAEELELEIPLIHVEDLVEIVPKWVAIMLPVIKGEEEKAAD